MTNLIVFVDRTDELQLLDRRLTDAFLQELIFSLCDTDIFVVNQVTLADQIFLTALQRRLQRDYPDQKVSLLLLLLSPLLPGMTHSRECAVMRVRVRACVGRGGVPGEG
jgi:hypothetical protein